VTEEGSVGVRDRVKVREKREETAG